MSCWSDVVRLCEELPGSAPTEAHEGSPAFRAGRHLYARRREDHDGRELVQVWSADMSPPAQLSGRASTFPRIDSFRYRVTVWAVLERLGASELAEMLLDSYAVRGGTRRAADVDEEAFLALAGGLEGGSRQTPCREGEA